MFGVTIFLKQFQRKSLRSLSTSSQQLVKLEYNYEAEIGTLIMNNMPVNSLSLEMIDAIRHGITTFENDSKIKGMILSSASPKVFSAGLDIREMYKPDNARLVKFWTSLQELWMQLYGTSLATGAAIGGASPAGGCLLACSCDYRVMGEGKGTIGLNETQLGIVAPTWFVDSYRNTIGHRQAERLLSLGSLLSPQEALAIGMVDEVVSVDKVIDHTFQEISKFIKIPTDARVKTKLLLRRPFIADLKAKQTQDLNEFVEFANSAEVQQNLGAYLAMLMKRNK